MLSSKKLAEVDSILPQLLNNPFKKTAKFCQSIDYSPNLATLYCLWVFARDEFDRL